MEYLKFILSYILIPSITCNSWNYDTLGPDTWKLNYPSCGSGQKQSPINIISAAAAYDSTLEDISFRNYDQRISWNITNNGHTSKALTSFSSNFSQVVAIKQDSLAVPSLTGSNYGKTFSLVQFHLHWGYNNYQGSEHLINYVKYPLELHMVHNATDGTLAVVGFLFQLSTTDNPTLTPLLNAAIYDSVEFNSMLVNFTLGSLLPNSSTLSKSGYYRYSGSLTTPPCTEGIIWSVYSYPLNISASQLNVFRNNTVLSNFRDIQPLYSRLVYSSINSKSNSLNVALGRNISFILICLVLNFYL